MHINTIILICIRYGYRAKFLFVHSHAEQNALVSVNHPFPLE